MEKQKNSNGFVPNKDKSKPVRYSYAHNLITNYHRLSLADQLKVPGTNNPIHGFIFDIEHLRKLASRTDVKSAFIGLGFRENELTYEDGYTVVLIGMDANDVAVTENYSMYDYCDPCPDRCPHFREPEQDDK